jgi:hypothetical protein
MQFTEEESKYLVTTIHKLYPGRTIYGLRVMSYAEYITLSRADRTSYLNAVVRGQ